MAVGAPKVNEIIEWSAVEMISTSTAVSGVRTQKYSRDDDC